MTEFEELHDQTDKPPAPIRLAVPQRCVNSIEMTFVEAFELELESLAPYPMIESFEGDDTTGLVVLANPEAFQHFFDGRDPTIKEVYTLRAELTALVTEKWRPQITIARALGPYRVKDGGPHVRDYAEACRAEGVEPWPPGITPLTD